MYLNRYCLRNFRRFESVEIKLEEKDTIFVGANNSGKTSATAAFRLFVSRHGEFKIYDFPSTLLPELDRFGESDFQYDINYEEKLPAIELDLWFTVTSSIYGRIAYLLPSISSEYTEVGVRLRFSVNQPAELHNAYRLMYPKSSQEDQKSLSYFLSQDRNLNKYFSLQYFTLEKTLSSINCDDVILHPLDKDEGRKTIDSLVITHKNSPRTEKGAKKKTTGS